MTEKNNHSEAAYRYLETEFGIKHQSILRIINRLRIIQKSRDLVYEKFVAEVETEEKEEISTDR